jgi:hypothetical protein
MAYLGPSRQLYMRLIMSQQAQIFAEQTKELGQKIQTATQTAIAPSAEQHQRKCCTRARA